MSRFASRPARYALAVVALLAGATCADNSITGPGGSGLRAVLGFVPALTKAAADIFKGLAAFQLEVDNIHLVLKYPGGAIAKDTVISLSAGADSIAIEASIALEESEALLDAYIDLRDGTQVLFSGHQQVRARRGGVPQVPPAIPIVYAGPGASATSLDLAPGDTTILSTDSLTLRASATNAQGQPVPDLVIDWSVKDGAQGSVTVAGVFRPSLVRGNTYVIARLPTGLRDSARINFIPLPSQLALISGNQQSGIVGRALAQPIIVEARGSDNLPVPGAVVSFAVTAGGGIVQPASVQADANGRASAVLTLGNVVGANSVQASIGAAAPVTITATGIPTGPGALEIVSTSPTVRAGIALAQQPVVQLRDSLTNLIATSGLQIQASVVGDGFTLGGTTVATTDNNGRATFTNLQVNGPIGSAQLRFMLANTSVEVLSSAVTVGAGHARALSLDPQPSGSALSGVMLATQPRAHLHDAFGNDVAVAGVPVTAALIVAGEGRTLGGTLTVNTDAAGLARFTDLSIAGTPGTTRLVFAAGDSIATVTSNEVTLTSGQAASLLAVTSLVYADTAGANVPPTAIPSVSLRDASNNPVPGIAVTFTPMGGEGSRIDSQGAPLVLTTDQNGNAALTSRRVQLAIGLDTVLVTTAGLNDTLRFVVAVTNGIATQLQFIGQPGNSNGGALMTGVAVQLLDQHGNPAISGASATQAVTLALSGGTAGALLAGTRTVTASAGVALFSDIAVNLAGSGYQLLASTATIAAVASADFSVNVGPAALLALVSGDEQGALLNEQLGQPLVVRVTDLGGNAVPGAMMTFAVDSGGGVFGTSQTTVNVQANSSGLASIDWRVGTGQQRVAAVVGTDTLYLRAYVAERVVLITEPSLSPQSGVPFATAPRAQLMDSAGHVVRRPGVVIETALIPLLDGGPFLTGSRGAGTDGNGIAELAGLAITGPITPNLRLEFYLIDSQEQPAANVARDSSAVIALLPGLPVDIVPEGAEFIRQTAAGVQTISARVTDGYNLIPNSPVTFEPLQTGQTGCALSSGSANTNASGIATIDVTTTGSLTSCVVMSRHATGGAESPVAFHRIAIAPSGTLVWTGIRDDSWNVSENWDGGLPSATSNVFIPLAAITTHLPSIVSTIQVLSMRIEAGAMVNVDHAMLSIRDSLGADGIVNGVQATVLMNGAGGSIRGFLSSTKLIVAVDGVTGACNHASPYSVSGLLSVDTVQVDCALSLDAQSSGMVVTGDAIVSPGALMTHTMGAISVGGSLSVGGQYSLGGTTSLLTQGHLVVAPNGRFVQAGGDVFVRGNATFNGFADLRSGAISLNRNFAHTGNSDNNRLAAALPHVMRFVGDATEPRQLFWDAPAGGNFSTLGMLEFATTGAGGINTATGTIGSHIRAGNIVLRGGSLFNITDGRHSISTLGASGTGLIVQAGAQVNNAAPALITVPNPVDPLTCLLNGIITGNFSCVSR